MYPMHAISHVYRQIIRGNLFVLEPFLWYSIYCCTLKLGEKNHMKKTVLALTMAASVLALSACSDKKLQMTKSLATSKAGDITKDEFI